MKDQRDLLSESYLNRKQIARLLKIPVSKARTLYAKADEIDSRMEFRVEPNKVRMKSVLQIAGISYEELKKKAAIAAASR